MSDRIDKLEAVRGAAALYVVLHHTIPHSLHIAGLPVGLLLIFGQEAVMLFFLLSGFVIKHSFESKKNQQFCSYFSQRFTRIYIPLIIIYLISYLCMSAREGEIVEPQFSALLKNLLMLQDWEEAKPNVIISPYMENTPLWSLAYEWWFYMLFYPISKYIRSDHKRDIIVFSSVIGAAIVYVFYPYFPVRIIMYFGIWWTGVYLASKHLADTNNKGFQIYLKPLWVLLFVSAVLSLNAISYASNHSNYNHGFYPFNEVRHFLFTIVALFVVYFWRKSGWVFFRQLLMPFSMFAPISYTMYISHNPVMYRAEYLSFINNDYLQWLGYFCVMLLLSVFIELVLYPRWRQPIQLQLNRLIERLGRMLGRQP